ncbi:PREDICTED: sugar transport protein 1-like [Tarenaya hassleriana]|uniref:sugar transport protein 1-like n=1 Tax=Tarenaya hassleriana TaxID=28532 RepID=UPI00053C25DC|nr:PREDICTED: sugar transport protein 1-like [Tarenaya hassleriana]
MEGGGRRRAEDTSLTCYCFLVCVAAAACGLMAGFNIGVIGGVASMPSFRQRFFAANANTSCDYDPSIAAKVTSAFYAAALFSSFLLSPLVKRKLGCKVSMESGCVLVALGALFSFSAQSLWMLVIGRCFVGIGLRLLRQSVRQYVSEMAPYRHRRALGMMFKVFIAMGRVMAAIVNYSFHGIKGGWDWRLSFGSEGVLATVFLFVTCIFLPSTPKHLLERGKPEQARSLLQRLRGVDVDVEPELRDTVCAMTQDGDLPLLKLFNRNYWPHLVMVVMIPLLRQLTGAKVMMTFAPALLVKIWFSKDIAWLSDIVIASVNLTAKIYGAFGIEMFGRRQLFLGGGVLMFLSQVVIAIIVRVQFGWSLPGWYATTVTALICTYVIGYSCSWGRLEWFVPSEIRSAALGVTAFVDLLSEFLVALLFHPMLCHVEFWWFLFVAFLLMLIKFLVYALLPNK